MLSNFIQKPIGIISILGAAVGGPYVAFETDAGTQLRQSLASRMSQTPEEKSDVSTNQLVSDPYSLIASKVPSGPTSNPEAANSNWIPSEQGLPNSYSAFGAQVGNSNFAPSGPIVSTEYGPATIRAIGPPSSQQKPTMPYSGVGYSAPLPSTYLESRSGPTSVIPGKTDQLWDYTLGTPTLNQIQQQPSASVGGGAIYDLREVIRFDIVPGWIPQRFARVSTVTSNVQMDGLRVPLITGTQPNDIAGTLTYYFDASQALKRINLHGLSGDPSQLANLMVQFYQLNREQSLGGQLFTSRWNNRITSVLQIAPAPIIYAGADHSKYIIFLELNQPTNQYGLSEEASEVLRTAQATQRW